MYMLTDLNKSIQDEKLRTAARRRPLAQVYAARRAEKQHGSARRLAGLRIRPGRRTAQVF
jgi:hypothetical protein